MRYVGGKSRIAKPIAQAINAATTNRGTLYEPFAGGCSVTAQLATAFTRTEASDQSEDLSLMWGALLTGWNPPHEVSEQRYKFLRTAEPSAERGFVGFGGSFGGKWFGGFARGGKTSAGADRNHQSESARAVERIRDVLLAHNVTFTHRDYRGINPGPGDVVYCDPPYASTQGYGAVGGFDNAEFWRTAESWVAAGADVFVSEYNAPENWTSIWSAKKRLSLTLTSQGRGERTEHLFTLGTAS